MTARELALLERAFDAEVRAAILHHVTHLIQLRGKLADNLVADGLLRKTSTQLRGFSGTVTISGYELTELGRLTYCMTCEDDTP